MYNWLSKGWDAQVPSGSVQVKVQQGWVTLSGAVGWFYQKSAAETAVRKLSGVIGVSNKIEVTSRVLVSDVKNKIMAALQRNADLEANAIRVAVEGGKVKIEGKVKAWYERDLIERAAS
jgi:osmotically-inducible protein OsmY